MRAMFVGAAWSLAFATEVTKASRPGRMMEEKRVTNLFERLPGRSGLGFRRFTAHAAHVVDAYSISGVAEIVANISQHVGDVVVGEIIQRNHSAGEFLAVHHDIAARALQNLANGALFIGHEE